MTTPVEEEVEVTPVVVSPLTALKNARAARTTRRPPARKATPRKPTASRAESAAKRGKYTDRIVGAIKSGAALIGVRNPVRGAIIEARAEPLARALDRVAAEDKRVDAFLTKASGWFGKSSAWGEFGSELGITVSAVVLTTGAIPTGPVGLAVAFLGGSVLNAAIQTAAVRAADDQIAVSYPGEAADPEFRAMLIQQYVQEYTPRLPQPADTEPTAPADPYDDTVVEAVPVVRFDGTPT